MIDRLHFIQFQLDEGAFEPIHEYLEDAGYDLRAPERVVLRRHDSIVIDTGAHFDIPPYWYGKIESKSGLNIDHGVVSLGGVVDSGYSGSVKVKLYNLSDTDYIFNRGDKVAQIIFIPCATPRLELVDKINGGARGNRGFGSTGR